MGKRIFLILFLLVFLCSAFSTNAQTKGAKVKRQTAKKPAICKAAKNSFPCPKEYKVALNGERSGIFLARNLEFDYSLYVITGEDNFDENNLTSGVLKTVLKTLYPKESQNYRWKDVEFNNENSSKFEIGKKSAIGFNANQIVTIDYRYISFEGKNIIVGTIVNGFFTGYEAENEFNDGRYTTNGGCSDAIEIIHSITGEKDIDKYSPCSRKVIIERKN